MQWKLKLQKIRNTLLHRIYQIEKYVHENLSNRGGNNYIIFDIKAIAKTVLLLLAHKHTWRPRFYVAHTTCKQYNRMIHGRKRNFLPTNVKCWQETRKWKMCFWSIWSAQNSLVDGLATMFSRRMQIQCYSVKPNSSQMKCKKWRRKWNCSKK